MRFAKGYRSADLSLPYQVWRPVMDEKGIWEILATNRLFVKAGDAFIELTTKDSWQSVFDEARQKSAVRSLSGLPIYVGRASDDIRHVLKMCKKDQHNYRDNTSLNIMSERMFTEHAAHIGVGVQMLGFHHDNEFGCFLLEFAPQTLRKRLLEADKSALYGILEQLTKLFDTMKQYRHYNLDLHYNNIVSDSNGRIVTIDQGQVVSGFDPELESMFESRVQEIFWNDPFIRSKFNLPGKSSKNSTPDAATPTNLSQLSLRHFGNFLTGTDDQDLFRQLNDLKTRSTTNESWESPDRTPPSGLSQRSAGSAAIKKTLSYENAGSPPPS